MKLSNLLTQTMICAALTAAPIMSSFSHAAPPVKKASEGGASGGGGNAATEQRLSSAEIDYRLGRKQVRIVAESLLYSFESLISSHTTSGLSNRSVALAAVAQKLKSFGLQNAVDVLYSSNFLFGEHVKSCVDPKTKMAVDAYTDSANLTICFDIKRLEARNLSKKNADSVLATLVLHEVAHIFGANEDEAQALQSFASDFSISLEDLNRVKMQSTLKLSEFVLNLNAAIRLLKVEASTLRICNQLTVQAPLMSDVQFLLVYNTSNTGTLLLPYRRIEKVTNLATASNMTIQGFCAEGSDRTDVEYYFSMTNGKARTEAGATILNSGFENREGLEKNLNEVLKLASQILTDVRESSPPAQCTVEGKRSSSCSSTVDP